MSAIRLTLKIRWLFSISKSFGVMIILEVIWLIGWLFELIMYPASNILVFCE